MNDLNGPSQKYEASGSSSDCEVILLLLDSYHDNEIDDAERLQVDKHLVNCAACNMELSNIDSLVKRLAALTPARSEIDFADLIEKQILAEQNISPSPTASNQSQKVVSIFIAKKWLAAAAAVLALALVGFQVTHRAHNGVSVASSDLSEVLNIQTQDASEKSSKLQDEVNISKPHAAQEIEKSKELNRISPARSNRIRTANLKVAEFDGDIDVNQKQNLVAITNPVQNNISEELGIKTDEDGLYAIKM